MLLKSRLDYTCYSCSEADRLEEREEHAKEAMQLGGALVALGATAGGGGAMAVDGLAALFINSQVREAGVRLRRTLSVR